MLKDRKFRTNNSVPGWVIKQFQSNICSGCFLRKKMSCLWKLKSIIYSQQLQITSLQLNIFNSAISCCTELAWLGLLCFSFAFPPFLGMKGEFPLFIYLLPPLLLISKNKRNQFEMYFSILYIINFFFFASARDQSTNFSEFQSLQTF